LTQLPSTHGFAFEKLILLTFIVAGDGWVVFAFFFFPVNLGAGLKTFPTGFVTFTVGFVTFAVGFVTFAARCLNRND
jgi:hypothetical protein